MNPFNVVKSEENQKKRKKHSIFQMEVLNDSVCLRNNDMV